MLLAAIAVRLAWQPQVLAFYTDGSHEPQHLAGHPNTQCASARLLLLILCACSRRYVII